jgi:hypothetical protein
MRFPVLPRQPLPPRLSMDEYVDFLEQSWREIGPERIGRQKDLEERVDAAFRIPPDPLQTAQGETAMH